MALVESAIGGVAATIIEQAIKVGGYAGQQIKEATPGRWQSKSALPL
ncbi:MAG: hypothetical protein AAFY26_07335 [Cyanobacteria bacterium J06638_22]